MSIEIYLQHTAELCALASLKNTGDAVMPGYTYGSVAEYLLDRGSSQHTNETLSDAEVETLFQAADSCGIRFKMKQCFYNSQMLIMNDHTNTMKYVEGYAQGNAIVPLHHAWVVMNEKIVDLTWRTRKPNHKGRLRNRIIGAIPDGWKYLGVVIPKKIILERVMSSGFVGTVIDDWASGHEELKRPRLGNYDARAGVKRLEFLGVG